jgi:hypothetical protein
MSLEAFVDTQRQYNRKYDFKEPLFREKLAANSEHVLLLIRNGEQA